VTMIEGVVMCCIFNAVSVALCYNKYSLYRQPDSTYAAGPLQQKCLGHCLNVKAIPCCNRALDVVSCFLRIELSRNPILADSIKKKELCTALSIGIEAMCDILFQIILLRFTGRIFRFHIFGKDRSGSLPYIRDLPDFLRHVQWCISQKVPLSRWLSKQHDGAISKDLFRHYLIFSGFFKRIASNLQDTVEQMRSYALDETHVHRRKHCINKLSLMFTEALTHAGAKRRGCVKWMAHACVSDFEEFVREPFGKTDAMSVPVGKYSKYGYQMVRHHCTGYSNCLSSIRTYVTETCPKFYLNVMGYERSGDLVLNMINGREFTEVDAEHFCCKIWLMAKLAMPHSLTTAYPKQCSAHTHPSLTLHKITHGGVVDDVMNRMELAFLLCHASQGQNMVPFIVPDFCLIYSESLLRKDNEMEATLPPVVHEQCPIADTNV
jgi:hypothetical protein